MIYLKMNKRLFLSGEVCRSVDQCRKNDVILADVFMANIDILGLLYEIKKSEISPKPMIMAMSSFDNEKLEREALQAGAAYYFLKPLDINTLAERIIQLTDGKN